MNILRRISDVEYQRLAWFGKLPNVVVTYEETMNVFLDDFAISHFIIYWQKIYGENEFLIRLRELVELMEGYKEPDNYNGDDNIIIADESWQAITKKAKETLQHWPTT